MDMYGHGLYDPVTGRHVVGRFRVSKQGLCLDEVVEKNQYIQELDVSESGLTDLGALQGLRDLVWLDASKNELQEVLGFETPSCEGREENGRQSWVDGAMWTGSKLQYANLSCNRISKVPTLLWHDQLRCLDLSHNKIVSVDDLSALVNLESLNLSFNGLQSIREIGVLVNLKELILDSNFLGELRATRRFPKLQTLSCKNNEVALLDGLENCNELEVLDLENNSIEQFSQINCLKDLEMLANVVLRGNPIENQQESDNEYRKRILFRLPDLLWLDMIEVTSVEKVSSKNFFGDDYEHRKLVFQTHFPNREFVSVVEPYADLELFHDNIAPKLATQTTAEALVSATTKVVNEIQIIPNFSKQVSELAIASALEHEEEKKQQT